MVEFCCRKTGADRLLDKKLQRMWKDTVAFDPTINQPAALRKEFGKRLKTTPKAEALSQSALTAALGATQLGILTGAAEVALGIAEAAPPPAQTVADPIQEAYTQGLDIDQQNLLFDLGYQFGRAV